MLISLFAFDDVKLFAPKCNFYLNSVCQVLLAQFRKIGGSE